MQIIPESTSKYKKLLPSAIDTCISYIPHKNNTVLVERVAVSKDQRELLSRFTHLKDTSFFEQRRELYKKIFDHIFTKNGKVIPPVSARSQKRRLILASTYSDSRNILLKKIQNNDTALPKELIKTFKKVDNGHAIKLDFEEIVDFFPEYQKALKEGYPYPSYVVQGEVRAIIRAAGELAQKCGYNIVDLSGTLSRGIPYAWIKEWQGVDPNSKEVASKKAPYKLTSICLAGEIDAMTHKPLHLYKNASSVFNHNLVKQGLKGLARPDSFQRLMAESDRALLVWDCGATYGEDVHYDVVVSASKGKLTIPHRNQWNQFKNYEFLQIRDVEKHYYSAR